MILSKRRVVSLALAIILFASIAVAFAPNVNAESQYRMDDAGLCGWYTLSPKCATGSRLDVNGGKTANGTNIQIYKNNNSRSQKFYISSVGNGYYVICNMGTDKVLDVDKGKFASGTNVQLWQYTYAKAQVWKIESAGSGYYYIKPVGNEKLALDVNKASSANKTNVALYKWQKNNKAQMWKLNKIKPSGTDANISISSVTHSYMSSSANHCHSYKVVNKTSSDSKVTLRPALNQSGLYDYYYFCKPTSADIRVKIVAGKKVLTNVNVLNCPKVFTVPAKYKEYTVYIMGAPSNNPAYYHQVQITNGGISKVSVVSRSGSTLP